jgi:hypothetical protein
VNNNKNILNGLVCLGLVILILPFLPVLM